VYLDTTTSILKCLRYSRGIEQVQILQEQDMSKKFIEMGMAAWIYTQPGGSSFVLESSASFRQIENESKHLPHPFLMRF